MGVKQQIPSSTNAPKSMQFAKLRGVDFSTSPYEVSNTRAVDMKNMINDDGVNHKRKGWTENNTHSYIINECGFQESLGVYDVTLSIPNINKFLKLYIYAGIKNNKVNIKIKPKETKESIYIKDIYEWDVSLDKHTLECFENKGYVYLLGCGEYNRIGVKESSLEGFDYELVMETYKEFAYTPITSNSINNKYELDAGISSYESFESANVLTPRRKNSFIIGEQARQYNIAMEVHEAFKVNFKKIIYRFTNNTTNEIVEVDASNKTYAIAQLQQGSYKFRIICDEKEQTLFQHDDFKPRIADIEDYQINIDNSQYYFIDAFRITGTITVNGKDYENPHMYVFSDIATQHYQITKWYKDYKIDSLNIGETATYVADVGYVPNYSYYNNTVYEFDTKAKEDTIVNITISSKYNLETEEYENDFIEYSASRGITKDYNQLKVQHNNKEYLIGFVNVERVILMDNKLSTYMQGVDNMIVEFESEDSTYTDLIKNCKYGKSFALTGYNDRLFVYGNDGYPATMYFTGNNDFSYFPFINFNVIGSNVNAISGLSVLNDSTIAVHKYNNYHEASIYYLTAENVTIENKNNVAFVTSVGTLGETPVNPYVCANLAGDNLILSKTGVYSIQTGTNIKVSERYAYERSGFVNSLLAKQKNIENAKAISYDNRYYLAINNSVLVADARYKVSPRDQDMNDTFNYEWWYWDNMPVKEWLIIDGKLHFLTNNGYVAEFVEDREDERILMLSSNGASLGLMSPVNDDTIFYQLDMNYVEWLKDGNIIQQNTENGTNKYIICTNDSTKYNGQFQLKDYITEEYLSSNVYLFGNDVKSVYICDKSNVVSEWYTPIVNMGTSIYSKNLLTSTLTFEPDIEGEVKYGFVTRRRAEPIYKDSNVKPTDGVSFDNLDFTDFSFAVGFACSRTLKTRIRNYNYIQFRIVSDNNKDCALNNFVVTYTIGRKNKGVR